MLRSVALSFPLVLSTCSLAVGQVPAPSNPVQVPQGPPRPVIIVTPGNSLDTHTPKPPDAQAQPQPDTTPRLKPADLDTRQNLTDGTRMQLIRVMDAEFVHVRKYFPVGEKNMVIAPDGMVKPGDAQLFRMAQTYGAAAKVGDRVQITNIVFKEKSIYFEINGGPKKKTKWYQHIEISGMGGSAGGVDPNQAQPTGAAVTLEFKKHVPEMTGAELKQMLTPVLDFSVKTAAEVFVDTLPPKIKEAVKRHEVLVGMNHDMVVMAKDRPPQKVREKDDKGKEYEEWIYGAPPQDTVFVRFSGDEVVLVKTAKVGGQITIKTEKEVDVKDGVPTLAALKSSNSPQDVSGAPEPAQPTHKPTLKRPDEQPDPMVQPAGGASANRQLPPAQPDEPQWGTSGKQPASGNADQQPAQSQEKNPQDPVKTPPM
ncbi:MAG TPA: hypothetical protein VGP89_09575 [Candidatus Angelobacter sp.]|nr:hypothetical protein [Candidatus Angelobacter sp.]